MKMAMQLQPGDRYVRRDNKEPSRLIVVTVLGEQGSTYGLFGEIVLSYWVRREDTGEEGWAVFPSPGAVQEESDFTPDQLAWQMLDRTDLIQRHAVVPRTSLRPTPEEVKGYLPANYYVSGWTDDLVRITGTDHASWTLDNYVIPRLSSGMIQCKEAEL